VTAGKYVILVLITRVIITFDAYTYSYSDVALSEKEKIIVSISSISYFFSTRK